MKTLAISRTLQAREGSSSLIILALNQSFRAGKKVEEI